MASKLEQSIRYIKSGNTTAGRALLIEILKEQPENDEAWFWMSAVVDSDELRQECLQEALKYNPRNSVARTTLARLQQPQHTPYPILSQQGVPPETKYVIKPVAGHILVLFIYFLTFLAQIPAIRIVSSYAALEDPKQVRHIMADVIDYRVRTGRGTWFEVRYRFRLSDDSRWYSCSDLTSMNEDLWCSIRSDAWESAQSQGNRLDVIYLSTNPWLNRPSAKIMDSTIGPIVIWVVITCLNIVAIVEAIKAWQQFARCKVAVQQGEVGRLYYWAVQRV